MVMRGRLTLLRLGLAAWALLAWGRLAQVQLLEHRSWDQQASEQQQRVINVAEPRGEIRSRDGRVLAGSLERLRIGVNTRRIAAGQVGALSAQLAPLVGMSEAEVASRLRQEEGFFYLARDLEPRIAPAVARAGAGVWAERSERRIYPHGSFAAPVLGFVNGEGIGQAGLEASFESTLRGVASRHRLITDSVGTPLELQLEREGRPGLTLRLALDSRVQVIVEEELARACDEIGARGAAAVVMDPVSGELLALASLPAYDPGRPGAADPANRRNRAVEDAIEPGSTFKPIIVAAALGAGVLDRDDLIDCSGGGIQVAGFFIRDHASYGLLSVRGMLAKSSNAGAVRVAHLLSPAQLDGFIRALGFGRPTGVELPAEASGIYRGPERWSMLSRAGLALGQEISASVLQVAQAYAVIANGGLLVRPILVLETLDARTGEPVTPHRTQRGRQVLSPEIARTVAGMLEAVVEEGTGTRAGVRGYRVAGKTGTAQKAVGGGGYGAGLHAAWFAGFFPAQAPRAVVVVCIDQPEKTFWASDVAAPVFGRIAARVTTLLGLPPTAAEAV